MASLGFIRVDSPICTFVSLDAIECVHAKAIDDRVVITLFVGGLNVGDVTLGVGDNTTHHIVTQQWIEDNLKKV